MKLSKGTLVLLTILLVACRSVEPRWTVTPLPTATAQAPSPTPSATPLPTSTPVATSTSTALPAALAVTSTPSPKVPALTPTATPSPTAPAPTPSLTPTPTSAWPILTLEQATDEVKLELLEQLGGYSLAVAVKGGMIYLGVGPRVVVLDETHLPVGQSEVLSDIVQDVSVVNGLAYVAVGEVGLVILDVKDVSSIHVSGTVSTSGDAYSIAVAAEDGLAYVVGDGQPGPEKAGFLSIVDVSSPEMPEQVATIEVPGVAYDVALVEHSAYVVYDDGLLVVDISDSAAPVEVAKVGQPQGTRHIAIADGYAYVGGYELQVLDVTDPARPHQVSRTKTRFPTGGLAVHGKLVYLVSVFCEMGHCGSTVHVRDASDPADPQEAGTCFVKSAVMEAFADGDSLYLASWQKGLQVVDVSDPASPSLIGEFASLGSVEDVAVSEGFAYVSDGAQSGLQVLDLGQVRVRGTAESARWAMGYAVVDGHAYVPVWLDGFHIVNVSTPDNPQETATVDLDTTEQAVVVGERAYVTTGYAGLAVLDVADPSVPRVLGELALDGLAEGLAVAGERAYVTVDAGEQSLLHMVDVADPARPGELGRVTLAGKGFNVALDLKAGYAYVAVADCDWYLGTASCSGGLQVVDIGDSSLPRTVVLIEVPGGVFDVAPTGERALVAAGHGGVWVLDVSAPENVRAVGWEDTAGWARSLDVAGDLVYVADQEGGLLVLRATW